MNVTAVVQTETAAAIYLTVYPQSLDRVSDPDLRLLGQQIAGYQRVSNIKTTTTTSPTSRQVFLRFAPEMQGSWMAYGVKPTQFLALWKRMFAIIKTLAPQTIIVWAPNGAMVSFADNRVSLGIWDHQSIVF
jgi:hypothetical protein